MRFGNKTGITIVEEVILALLFMLTVTIVISYLFLIPDDKKNLLLNNNLTETTLASEDTKHSISVSLLPTTTEAASRTWKMSEITLDGKKFKVFHSRIETTKLDWNSKAAITVSYILTDDENLTGFSGFHIWMMMHEMGFFMDISNLNVERYRPDSQLQKIILDNTKEVGQEIFRQIFDGLETNKSLKE